MHICLKEWNGGEQSGAALREAPYAGSLSPAASSCTHPKKKEFAEARKLLLRANEHDRGGRQPAGAGGKWTTTVPTKIHHHSIAAL